MELTDLIRALIPVLPVVIISLAASVIPRFISTKPPVFELKDEVIFRLHWIYKISVVVIDITFSRRIKPAQSLIQFWRAEENNHAHNYGQDGQTDQDFHNSLLLSLGYVHDITPHFVGVSSIHRPCHTATDGGCRRYARGWPFLKTLARYSSL